MSELSRIQALAAARGIDQLGVCAFDTDKRPLLFCRAVKRLPEKARTVIVCLFPYRVASEMPRNISRYACVPDYHEAAGAVLAALAQDLKERFPKEAFEPFMDNSPLNEVRCAVAAGLGVRGDNGLFISDEYGSYVFIGCVVTSMSLPAQEQERVCLHCGACVKVCPGGCLPDNTRDTCVSALTQKKGILTDEETARIQHSGSLWGCDMCQDVCPLNRDKRIEPHPCFTWYQPMLTQESLCTLQGKAYAWRGEAVLRRNLALNSKD